MLYIHFGSMDGEIYNPAVYFGNQYDDAWIIDPLSVEMIADVDKSKVIGPRLIDSPVLGAITPKELSGGVKTLMLMAFDDSGKVFNASAGGNNCAKWIIEIAKRKDLTITLHNIMSFKDLPVNAVVLNDGRHVHNYSEYLEAALDWL